MPELPECIHSACSKQLLGCNHYFGTIKNVKYQYLHLSDFDNNKGKVDFAGSIFFSYSTTAIEMNFVTFWGWTGI